MRQLTQSRLQKYPAISDLQKRAKQRLPLIAWEYLDMGTGDDIAVSRNRIEYCCDAKLFRCHDPFIKLRTMNNF